MVLRRRNSSHKRAYALSSYAPTCVALVLGQDAGNMDRSVLVSYCLICYLLISLFEFALYNVYLFEVLGQEVGSVGSSRGRGRGLELGPGREDCLCAQLRLHLFFSDRTDAHAAEFPSQVPSQLPSLTPRPQQTINNTI